MNEQELEEILAERTDLKYASDVAPDNQAVLVEKFGNRVYATPKKWEHKLKKPMSTQATPQLVKL